MAPDPRVNGNFEQDVLAARSQEMARRLACGFPATARRRKAHTAASGGCSFVAEAQKKKRAQRLASS
jgi:hypothetical protein